MAEYQVVGWMDQAACRRGGVDPDLWFPATATSATVGMAAHICLTHCDVLPDCDRYRRDRVWRCCVIAGVQYAQDGDPRRAVATRQGCSVCAGPT